MAAGLLKGRGRQRTDAHHVLAAVRRLSRLELAGECGRAALFDKAALVTDGRHVSSQGVRAGAATELAQRRATDDELERAGRWRPGSRLPREVYVRPAQAERNDPFARIPVHNPAAAAQG